MHGAESSSALMQAMPSSALKSSLPASMASFSLEAQAAGSIPKKSKRSRQLSLALISSQRTW